MRIKKISHHLMVQQIDSKQLICSWGRNIYHVDTFADKIDLMFSVPGRKKICNSFIGTLVNSPSLRRINNRPGILQVLELDDLSVVAIYDQVHVFDAQGNYKHGSGDLARLGVCGPLSHGAATGAAGDVLWGEYQNHRPSAPRVIQFLPMEARCEISYCFSLGQVKHVHSVSFDPIRKWHWICTGDLDDECGLYYTKDNFKNIHCLGRGDQGWRMVSLVPLKDKLIWGSDLGADVKDTRLSNYIYEFDFRTGRRKQLQEVCNPIYYSYQTPSGKILFGTTYEPGSTVGTSPKAGILCSSDCKTWIEIVSFPYEYVKRPYGTKYGTIFFPKGQSSDDRVYFTPYNVAKYDACLMCVDVSETYSDK